MIKERPALWGYYEAPLGVFYLRCSLGVLQKHTYISFRTTILECLPTLVGAYPSPLWVSTKLSSKFSLIRKWYHRTLIRAGRQPKLLNQTPPDYSPTGSLL